MVTTPESDLNSNTTTSKFSIGGIVGVVTNSINSSQDYSHDNSDYQWFLDFGYRENLAHQSVLSSLCDSYAGIKELPYYDDIANHLDANLAEVDIESFRAEDMNSLLSKIPNICKSGNFNTELDNSIYKTELLFSPIKESHISIDSLDLESYPDNGDIILTCKANKSNYTIAFEGSALYSDESFYVDQNENSNFKHSNKLNSQNKIWKTSDSNVIQIDNSFTTWSKIKDTSINHISYPSKNNHLSTCLLRKCFSLPNINTNMDTTESNVHERKNESDLDKIPIKRSFFKSNNNIKFENESESTPDVSQKPAFNLVKLFIQQKSCSTDTCMDVSSGCWPSNDGSSNLYVDKESIERKNMIDSGKSSNLSRNADVDNNFPAEESFQLDSLDIYDKNKASKELLDNNSLKYLSKANIRNNHFCNVINNNFCNNVNFPSNNNQNIIMNTQTKSMQTSNYSFPSLNFVPPSFLSKLNMFGEEQKAPVFVVYPNYTLPDLNFIKQAPSNSEIFLTPFKLDQIQNHYKLQKQISNEDVFIKNLRPSQIKDWKSLLILLPNSIVQKLEHIIPQDILNTPKSIKPMFCMSPPIKRNKEELCDCFQYFSQRLNTSECGSSEKPVSSGYRGSSTLLNDSELNVGDDIYIENKNENIITPRTLKSILRNHKNGDKRNSMFENKKNNQMFVGKRLSLPVSYMYPEIFNSNNRNNSSDVKGEEELARIRAENFLLNIPKTELKHYEEIAHILNSNDEHYIEYDSMNLKREVNKASQKKVSFTENLRKHFVTPPNSPNISMSNFKVLSSKKKQKSFESNKNMIPDTSKLGKISSNRFKRLQIQWELLSKESSMLNEFCNTNEYDSNKIIPANPLPKSKIPRPVSYPVTKLKSTPSILSNKLYSYRAVQDVPTKIPSLRTKGLSQKSVGALRHMSSTQKHFSKQNIT